MRFSVVALAAAGLASAQDSSITITSTMTKTLTLTACAEGYTGCPIRHTSTPVPVVNTTTSAAPKWNVTNSTSVYCPTSTGAFTTTQLPVTTAAQTTQPSVPAVKPSTGAAAGVTVAVGAALAAAFAAAL